MKIDLVIPSLEVGGSERQLVGLAVGLKAAGHDVGVITLQSGGALEGELLDSEVPVSPIGSLTSARKTHCYRLQCMRLPGQMIALARHWRARRPDAIQAWLPEAQVVALPIAAMLGIPQRIMALRSMSAPVRLTALNRWIFRATARCSTLVSANAQAILDDRGWPIGSRKTRVISNAVSLPVRRSTPARQPARGIVVANLTPIKGHRILVEALALLEDAPPFTFVGSGIEGRALRKQLAEARLESRVDIVEGVTNPSSLLAEAQFFVLPSPSEGLPNAILEAMAAGLPTIAFRVGGIPEIIEDGETGLLVDPGDVPGLARAIGDVASDAEWRARAGAHAAARAGSFDWKSLIRQNLEMMNATPAIDLRYPEGDVP